MTLGIAPERSRIALQLRAGRAVAVGVWWALTGVAVVVFAVVVVAWFVGEGVAVVFEFAL